MFSYTDSVLDYYLTFLLMALGSSIAGFLTVATTVVNWFEKRRGVAMGIAMSGFGIGGLLVPAVAWSPHHPRLETDRLHLRGFHHHCRVSHSPAVSPEAGAVRVPAGWRYHPWSRLRWRLFAGVPGTQRNVRRRRCRRLHSQGSNADTRVLAAQYGARHGPAHGWRSLPAPGPTHNGERRPHHNGGGRRGVGDDRIQHSGTGGAVDSWGTGSASGCCAP